MGQHYSQRFKEQIIKKLLLPDSKGITALSRELGIPPSTIATWRKKMQISCSESSLSRLPKDWSLPEKINAVFESGKLQGDELGRWLRENGIKTGYLELWKKEIIDMSTDKTQDLELKQAKKIIKELEVELRNKEKALAEASALLVLKKKAHLIWGEEDS